MRSAQCFLCLCVGSNRGAGMKIAANRAIRAFSTSLLFVFPFVDPFKHSEPGFFCVCDREGLSLMGELNEEMILRTGFLHAGQFVNGLAESGRCSVNFPPH